MLSARHAILDLLSAVEGPLSVRALLRAGTVLGLPENTLRVTLSRLKRDGFVRCSERGSYELAGTALRTRGLVSSWRRATRRGTWSGAFILVHTQEPGSVRFLRLLGLCELRPGLHLRPDNLEGGLSELRRRLHQLGIERRTLVMRADLTDDDRAEAIASWDVRTIEAGQRETSRRVCELLQQFDRLPLDARARHAFVTGGEAIGQIVLDPRLPVELLDPSAFDELVAAMLTLDRVGRAAWAEVLSGLAELGDSGPSALGDGPAFALAGGMA